MSYEEKLQQAKSALAEHNKSITKPDLTEDDFIEKLKAAGGTSEERLRHCTWEDLEKIGIVPLLAKEIAAIFRAREESKEPQKFTFISEARAQGMPLLQLLGFYNPREPDNYVGKRLQSVTRGKKCIVFDDNNKVSIVASKSLIEDIMEGLDELQETVVDGRPYKTYAVGERPEQYADINPLYPTKMLRANDVCSETNFSWKTIPIDVRMLVYLAVMETREIVINTVDQAHFVLEIMTSIDAETRFKQLSARYPKAGVLYDQKKKAGDLPLMHRIKGSLTNGRQDPFRVHRKY